MNLEQIQNKIIEQIGCETIDKFIEDKDGNLTGIATISVTELVKDIYEAAKVDYTEQNERLKYKLGLIVKDNQDLKKDIAELEKEIKEETPKFKPLQDIYVLCEQHNGGYYPVKLKYAGYKINFYAYYRLWIWTGGDNYYLPEMCFATEAEAQAKWEELKNGKV